MDDPYATRAIFAMTVQAEVAHSLGKHTILRALIKSNESDVEMGLSPGPLAGFLRRIVETAGGAYFNGFVDGAGHAWRIATGADRFPTADERPDLWPDDLDDSMEQAEVEGERTKDRLEQTLIDLHERSISEARSRWHGFAAFVRDELDPGLDDPLSQILADPESAGLGEAATLAGPVDQEAALAYRQTVRARWDALERM
jgi:hypothetical protein